MVTIYVDFQPVLASERLGAVWTFEALILRLGVDQFVFAAVGRPVKGERLVVRVGKRGEIKV